MWSCVMLHQLSDINKEEILKQAARITEAVSIENSIEEKLFHDSLLYMLEYMTKVKGEELLANISTIQDGDNFKDLIYTKFKKTPMAFGRNMVKHWDSESTFNYKTGKQISTESAHFIYLIYEGTKAHDDIESIKYMCEKYLTEILYFAKYTITDFEKALAMFDYKKIPIELPPDRKGWSSFFSIAGFSFGMSASVDGVKFSMSLKIPYFNSSMTTVITHEITHLIDLILKLGDESTPTVINKINNKIKHMKTTIPLAQQKTEIERYLESLDWQALFELVITNIFPADTPLGEGFAEYMSKKFNLFHRFFFYTPEERITRFRKSDRILKNFLHKNVGVRGLSQRTPLYTSLHSVVKYLIEVYGEDKFIAFYFSPPLNEESLYKFYDKTWKELETEWREYYTF